MMNTTQLSGYFRDVVSILAFLLGVVFAFSLILFYRQKKAGWLALGGFFLLVSERILWRLITTFWLGNVFQIVGDYERIYLYLEIVGSGTFILGFFLISMSMLTLARAVKKPR